MKIFKRDEQRVGSIVPRCHCPSNDLTYVVQNHIVIRGLDDFDDFYQRANPHIEVAGSPFYVNTEHRPWPVEPGRPRLAALSSFGFSGTNAHAVIEQAPDLLRRDPASVQDHLVVLSAFSTEQLRVAVERLVERLRRCPDTDLGDVSATLMLGEPTPASTTIRTRTARMVLGEPRGATMGIVTS